MLNIAAQTDDVQIEGNRQINPIISYDEIPYEIIENYDPSGSGGSDGAFTVSKYPEEYKDKIKEWKLDTYYYPGDIVYFEGEYWQAVRTIYTAKGDKNKEPGHPHSFLWKSLNENWEEVNKGGSEKSTYDKYDVVVHNGKYYMSRIDFNSLPVTTIAAWIEVYWWNDKAEPEERRLGWSYTPKGAAEGYVSIYELWWGI